MHIFRHVLTWLSKWTFIHLDSIQELFEPVEFTQENGSTEQATYMLFAQFLMEAEGMQYYNIAVCVYLLISTYVEANPAGDDSTSLEVLFFFSGVDKVSLTGLPYKPKIKVQSYIPISYSLHVSIRTDIAYPA